MNTILILERTKSNKTKTEESYSIQLILEPSVEVLLCPNRPSNNHFGHIDSIIHISIVIVIIIPSLSLLSDPLTQQIEYYLSVGMNSGIEEELNRKPLNVLVLLDISGSMGSPFSGDANDKTNKLDVAKQALIGK